MKRVSKTLLKKLVIKKFRALKDVEIEFGNYVTLVCGKNGTSKSSIIGIAAQIFSFEKDYENDENLSFQQIAKGKFKSQYQEHFRISEKFDKVGSMKVNIELFDGYTNKDATAELELMSRGKDPRPVVRNNSTAIEGQNKSRNFTHPVIFLSLKRLYPIADRTKYDVSDFDYLGEHEKEFRGLTNELLNCHSTHVTGTRGTISSAVSHGDNYDQESVSAGEDNAGQIILALMSFKKLKEEYANYKGGLLLIDEADAALFPTAQINLLKIFERECKNLNLQVIMTSHSPTLIEKTFDLSQKFRKKYKTVYLSNTYGSLEVKDNWSWEQIYADIHTTTISASSGNSLPKINVYFEDKEAADFFNALIYRQPIRKFTKCFDEVSLGYSNYINLIEQNVPEFSRKSIICLDADARQKTKGTLSTVIYLPGELPPDQLIFEHLYNLPPDHDFWDKESMCSRDVFTQSGADVIREFDITGVEVNIKERLENYKKSTPAREIFKKFYESDGFKKILKNNPWKHWIKCNAKKSNEFLEEFRKIMLNIMRKEYNVGVDKVSVVKCKPING